MELQEVGIYGLVPGTDRCKVEPLLPLADEVLHPAAVLVIVDDLPVPQLLHVGDDERVHMDHLAIRFFSLEHHMAGRTP